MAAGSRSSGNGVADGTSGSFDGRSSCVNMAEGVTWLQGYTVTLAARWRTSRREGFCRTFFVQKCADSCRWLQIQLCEGEFFGPRDHKATDFRSTDYRTTGFESCPHYVWGHKTCEILHNSKDCSK